MAARRTKLTPIMVARRPSNLDALVLYSTDGVLCSYALGFDAECMYSAWGGIRLGEMTFGNQKQRGMVELYLYTSSGRDRIPPNRFFWPGR